MKVLLVLFGLLLVNPAVKAQIELQSTTVLREVGAGFALLEEEFRWQRPVKTYIDGHGMMLLLAGQDDSLSVLSLTGFTIPSDQLLTYAKLGRHLLKIATGGRQGVLDWYDEWSQGVGDDYSTYADSTFQGIEIALTYRPTLRQLSVTVSNAGDSLPHE